MKQKILLFGGSGLVGSRILQLLSERFEFIAPTHDQVDLTNSAQIQQNIAFIKPEQILYAAGYTNVDKAEEEQEMCSALNAKAVKDIAEVASSDKIPVHYLSTDYVFDGEKSNSAYTEEDEPNPLATYAKSK